MKLMPTQCLKLEYQSLTLQLLLELLVSMQEKQLLLITEKSQLRSKKPSGQLIIVKVDPDNKVKTIRDAIKEAEQIAITGYSLKFNGQVLDEEKTIAAAGL
jgi:hypothetical protein